MVELIVIERKTFKTDSKSESALRAHEVKEAFSPVLDCLRTGHRNSVINLFEDYVDGVITPNALETKKKKLLTKPLVRMIYNNMCMAWLA